MTEHRCAAGVKIRWREPCPECGANSRDACPRHYQQLGKQVEDLTAQLERAKEALRPFPMLDGPRIPWALAEIVYEGYSRLYGTSQSLDRLAARGGFGWDEVPLIFKNLTRRYPELAEQLRARAALAALEGKGDA